MPSMSQINNVNPDDMCQSALSRSTQVCCVERLPCCCVPSTITYRGPVFGARGGKKEIPLCDRLLHLYIYILYIFNIYSRTQVYRLQNAAHLTAKNHCKRRIIVPVSCMQLRPTACLHTNFPALIFMLLLIKSSK